MGWAARRRSLYIVTLGGSMLLVLVGLGFYLLYEAPTCFDGTKNADEIGIDCGGSCEKVCTEQVASASVLWARSFLVNAGNYSLTAYVKNPNAAAGVKKISYLFRLFDNRNLLISERRGSTFLLPNSVNPIFEAGVATGERIPARTFFEFSEEPEWSTMTDLGRMLSVTTRSLSNTTIAPRLDAELSNLSIDEFRDIEVVAIIFDSEENAIGASRTFIDLLPGNTTTPLVFTWPRPFPREATRLEIIPRPTPQH